MSSSINDWLGDDEQTTQALVEGFERARGGAEIKNLFKRNEIGPIDKPTVIWLVTQKYGELYRHSLGLPNRNWTMRNCAAPADQQDNAIALCAFHAHVSTGGGAGKYGDPKLNHEYYFIGLVGSLVTKFKITDVEVDGKKVEKEVPVTRPVWGHELRAIELTSPMAREIGKYMNNRDYPKGANGNICAYPFKLWSYQSDPKQGKKGIRYKVELYLEADDVAPGVEKRPTQGLDPATNKLVPIDMSAGQAIYDSIREACRPSNNERLKAALAATAPDDEQFAPDGDAPAANPAPAADAPATGLSSSHDFESDTPAVAVATKPAPVAAKKPASTTALEDERF